MSVSVETVVVIVFVDTVVELVICGAVTLVDTIRGGCSVSQKGIQCLTWM